MTPCQDTPAPSPADPARVAVLGVGISAIDVNRTVARILSWIESRERRYVAVAAVHSVVDAQDFPEVKKIMNGAGLCVPDGVPLVWLCRLAGHRGTARVFGPDLMLALSAELAARGGSAFYYGGAPGVADDLAGRMGDRFPGLRTAGTFSPPFRDLTDREAGDVVGRIEDSGADVLWIGLGSPKQERWMAAFRDRLSVPAMIGVGAAFDYNTGRLRRAPRWMQAAALEWLYRLAQEPRRLWRRYARSNPRFVYYLLLERLGIRDFRAPEFAQRTGSPETDLR